MHTGIFDGEEPIMKLKDTGLTAADIKAKVKKYMVETY